MLITLCLVGGCGDGDDGDRDGDAADPIAAADGTLSATIRRTTGGMPHVIADDLASAAFGAGYAQAQDNVCLIADAVIKARGERARWFGPGADNANIVSDFGYRALGVREGAEAGVASSSAESRALLEGFVAGYNRYLEIAPAEAIPGECRDQPWLAPISAADLFAYYRVVAGYASGSIFAESGLLLAAVPPGVDPRPAVVDGGSAAAATPLDTAFAVRAPSLRDEANASNAWGIGAEMTEGGRGALLANPHFPYSGTRRLHPFQLTVPGYLDVLGAGLIGTAVPLIGFNEHVAWSHTVSTGTRTTAYELELADGDALGYVKEGETVPLTSRTLRIEVANGTAEPTVLEREFWSSGYGPMIDLAAVTDGALPAWSDGGRRAFSYRDANADADGLLDTWLKLARARGLDDFQQAFRDCGTTLWTNSIYADDRGNAFYVDSSSVPNLSDAALANVAARRAQDPLFASLFERGLTLLDGSDARDDWIEGPCDGRVPYESMPKLERRDFVQNSNSSHWATNPASFLTGYSALYGDERREINARTRLGLSMLQDPDATGFAAVAPAGQDGRFGAADLLDTIWNDRAFRAETLLDELRARCELIGSNAVALPDGTSRDVAGGCAALGGWDGTYSIESTGAHVFRVTMANYLEVMDADLTVPFDPLDPVGTPSTPSATARGTPNDAMLVALARGLDALDAASIAHDAPLGSVQTWQPSGGAPPGGEAVALDDPLPWHGGSGEVDGAFNAVEAVTSDLQEDTAYPRLAPEVRDDASGLSTTPGEGWRIGRGTSWHFGLEFTDDGPEAFGLVSYSPTVDPESPWFLEQGRNYSGKVRVPIAFSAREIEAALLPDGVTTIDGTLRTRR